MAQGCWSVVPVCATSYSWTTGPHRGAMESPQTAAGTRDPATPRGEQAKVTFGPVLSYPGLFSVFVSGAVCSGNVENVLSF